MRVAKNSGDFRYRQRCIDKLGYPFLGDERLLDVGCGDGGVAALLRERVGEVVAVDVERSPEWQNGDGLQYEVADAERLPFADGAFDLIHSKDSLHHMGKPQRALEEYRRVLKPGGAALIVEANRYSPSLFVQMTLLRGHQHFTRERFRALLSVAFPNTRFGSFEAHYVPGAGRLLPLQERVEETLEGVRRFNPLLSYNFAVARSESAGEQTSFGASD